jgi:5-methylcytosine-specific restriction endonuclease McrA
MKAKPGPARAINAAQLWRQFEDLVIPQLHLGLSERAVYSHLLRHTHLEGLRRLRFSIKWLSKGIGLVATEPARKSIRSLSKKGALRLVERSKAGHVVDVLLPGEIPAIRRFLNDQRPPLLDSLPPDIEKANFLQKGLRESIHAREGGRCFYCLRDLPKRWRCLDHVVPQARHGDNSFRNLVSSCIDCNSWKGERPAEDFLRGLYRKHRLSALELAERLRALDKLSRGKLKPILTPPANPIPRRGRPRLSRAA